MTTRATTLRRRVLTIAVVALALLVAGTAVFAATRPPTFKLKVATGVKAFAPGQPTGFAIDIERIRGFKGPVRMNLSDLPKGARVDWRLPDGRRLARHPERRTGAVLPANERVAYAIVHTTRAVRPGVYRPLVTAGGGAEVKRRMRKRITILAPVRAQEFSRNPTSAASRDPEAPAGLLQAIAEPRTLSVVGVDAERRIVQTEDTTFGFDIERGGTVGPVDLKVEGLPEGATATWSPSHSTDAKRAVLTVQTQRSTRAGTYDLTITGRHQEVVADAAAATLVVTPYMDFTIDGGVGALSLGQSESISMEITNPYDFDLRIVALNVDVSTDKPGCDASENFDVRQLDLTEPLVVPPGTHEVRDLVSDPHHRPEVTFVNLPTVNQDACRGARLDLTYTGTATR